MSTAVAEIVRICENLTPEKQMAVFEFARSCAQDGDAAWERIIASKEFLPKLAAFEKASAEEGDEPLDLSKL